MITRCLERKEVVRASVASAELLKAGRAAIELKTTAVVRAGRQLSSADSAMFEQQSRAKVGEPVEGRLRLDVLTDAIFRVRYAEGGCVPENATPMVVGAFAGPASCEIDTSAAAAAAVRRIGIRTKELSIAVLLDPFRIEVRGPDGRRICGIGGPEKNNFCTWDSVNTGICRTLGDKARPLAAESFDLLHDECVYGLGERFIKLNKVGQTIDLNMEDALGVTTPRSYKNVPFYVSTHGYGVFFNHSSLMTFWVGSRSAADVQVAAEDDFLDYFVIAGSIKEVLSRYTDITGKGSVPPRWTFGYWQSKLSYTSAEETLDIARKLRQHEIPCDVIHLDTHWFKQDWYCNLEFDKQRFPDPKAYLDELARMGFKVSIWQLPYIPEGSDLFNQLKAVDGFVKTKDGAIYNVGICFTPGFKGIVGCVDYTNPAAVRVHQEFFRRLFRLGVKVVKTDFGEAAPLDGVYHDGTPGHRMHNLYPLLYNKAIFEVTTQETCDAAAGEAGVVWARSAWAGNQRYPLHWGGDNSPSYSNIIPQLEGGLSFGLSGFQFWSQDIGGFCSATNDQLLIRWMQVGMFISHSRIHGVGNRELYKFGPEAIRICRDYLRLRYRLMPYIHGSAIACVASSLPMLRALVIEYQDDPNVRNLGDEFLFGSSILAAPIADDTNARDVYLPEGRWTDWWTHEQFEGGGWMRVEADLETMPLYIREGGIVPMGPVMNYVDEKRTGTVDLLVALYNGDGRSAFSVPVNGELVAVEYKSSRRKHVINVGASSAKFNVVPIPGDAPVTVNIASR